MILVSIAAALVCGCYGGSAGEVAQGTLTFQEFKDYSLVQSFGPGGYGMVDQTGRSGQGYTVPKMAGKPAFFTISMMNQRAGGRAARPLVGVLGKSDASLKSPDVMWVDWNYDKKFDDSERAVLVPNAGLGSMDVFKPVAWPKVNGKTVYVVMGYTQGGPVMLMPAGCMGSTVELGGKQVKVGIVDANLNGVYGEPFGTRSGGDLLLVDRKGDGKFDPARITSLSSEFSGDIVPLLGLNELFGTLYEITVSQDGGTVAFKPNTDPSGTVHFSSVKDAGLAMEGPKGLIYIQAVDGNCRLPAASYKIAAIEYKATDPKGVDWTFDVSVPSGKNLDVVAGQVTPIPCGPPLSVALKVESAQGSHSFSLAVKDGGGFTVSSPTDSKGARPDLPKLTITDSKGKLVKSLTFSFG
jgi:hypothetical protein